MQNNENKSVFNTNEYTKEYNLSHYKRINVNMTKSQNNIISEYCKDIGISQSKYITACALYCIDNAIDINELLSHLK